MYGNIEGFREKVNKTHCIFLEGLTYKLSSWASAGRYGFVYCLETINDY